MDVLTHGFVPYAAFTWAGRPRRERAAAALGGFAPDIDTSWAWTASADPALYPLVHRGFSHAFLAAPLVAVAVLVVLGSLGRWSPAFARRPYTRSVFVALVIGSLSHLALDAMTITGVPLLWPLVNDRVTLNWFFFSVPYMLPASLVFWFPVWRGRATDRWVKTGGLVLVGILLVAGGVRFVSHPDDLSPDERATPGTTDWTWVVTRRNETGVTAQGVRWGERLPPVHFVETNRTAAQGAIAGCWDHPDARGWRWGVWSDTVAQARGAEDGGWDITLRDAARLWMEAGDANSLGRRLFGTEDDRALHCHVAPDGAVSVERRGGFWG